MINYGSVEGGGGCQISLESNSGEMKPFTEGTPRPSWQPEIVIP